jgi:hypothetical protein
MGGVQVGEHSNGGEEQERAAQGGKNTVTSMNSFLPCLLYLLCSLCLLRGMPISLLCLLALFHVFCSQFPVISPLP